MTALVDELGPPTRTAEDVVERALTVGGALFAMAEALDEAADFPTAAITRLHASGLLLAPFGRDVGGDGIALPQRARDLFDVLRHIGGGDLSVGRLYEGHVNAVTLVYRYGTQDQVESLASDVREGAVSAVWNAEGGEPLRLFSSKEAGLRFHGRKILASGAGQITRPLVTALWGEDQMMTLPRTAAGVGADLSSWTAQGMRSSATGGIELTGLRLNPSDLVGLPGDYKLQPAFSGGAWRFCAVQLGAMERLVDLFRGALLERHRDQDPYQLARVAQASAHVETAALWIEKAALMVAAERLTSKEIVAYVGLTRMVTERAGLDVLENVHRGIGLASFLRPNAVERISRDLATYLRQPAPDGAMADAAATILASPKPISRLWSLS